MLRTLSLTIGAATYYNAGLSGIEDVKTRLHIGTFELTERIGVGGMAEVWRAEHAALGTAVAVKVITGSRALDPRYHERFTREVQAVARLNHPGIVRVFDYGKVEGEGGHGIRPGSPFLVMELADAGTVEDDVPKDFLGLRRVLLNVLDALAYSHARGVIHRDIKPGNVLLTRYNGSMRAKLTDFGIAHADDPDTDLTRGSLNEAAGTPDYMPPEQLQGRWRDYSPGTDLYALGCMAWEIATGSVPFDGSSPIQIAMAHMTEELPPFQPRFAVPEGFSDWLHRLLEKEPHERFARAADAAFMLSRLERTPSGQWDAAPTSNVFVPDRPETGQDFSYAEDDYEETTVLTHVLDWDPALATNVLDDEGDDATTVLNLAEVSWVEATSRVEMPSERPPVPRDWRREIADHVVVTGMGLGLFGLREIPFVGRHDERDVIWDALRDVSTRRKPRTVLIEGRSGTGKSRLVEWACERAEEVGAATGLKAVHGAVENRKHGLGHMLERYFVTWRLDAFETVRVRVQDHLQRLWANDDTATLEFLDQESRAVASIAAPHSSGGQKITFSSMEERLAPVIRLVKRFGRERPLMLWIDDAQWGEEGLELARKIVRDNELPVLILLTVQVDAKPDERARELLDEFARLPSTRRVQLNFLEPEFQFELVQRLAGLEPSAAQRVVSATGGNPLFAVQLVGHWVEKGALVPTHDGFKLTADADVPLEIHTLWTDRVDDLAARFGGESQRIALELAATLGDDVTEIEWQATCMYGEVEPHERLIDELVDQGLAKRFEGGFSFVHKLLADSIRSEARNRGRAREHELTCAEVLRTIYGHKPERVLERVATHLVAAEAWELALEPLELVAKKHLAAGAFVEAQDRLEQRKTALDALGVDGFDRRRVENWLYQGLTHLRAGNPAEAEFEFQRVMNVASPQRWRMEVALAQRGLGELAADAGEYAAALEAFNKSEGYYGDGADPSELATLYEARAEAFKSIGNQSAAREDLSRALDLHRTVGDKLQELNVLNRVAATFLSEGDVVRAQEVAQWGIEEGQALGNRAAEAGCWMTMGEIARLQNNFDYARHCYSEAERLDELSGSRQVWVVRTSAAMLEIAAENWQHAANRFDELAHELETVGFLGMLPIVQLGQAVCHVAYGEWDEFDAKWSQSLAEIERAGLVERDIPWLAEVAGDLCERRNDPIRARDAYRFAMTRWDELGELWKARELRIRIRTSTQ